MPLKGKRKKSPSQNDPPLPSKTPPSKKKSDRSKITRSSPLVEINLATRSASQAAPPSIGISSSKNLLNDLLFPLPTETFFDDIFRKKALHVTQSGPRPDRFREVITNYMFDLDPEQLFQETSSDNIFVWLNGGNGGGDVSRTIQSIEISDPETALTLLRVGHHSTYCRAPPELEQPLVASMLRDTRIGCGQYDPTSTMGTTLGRGEVECFYSTKGHFTNWHIDFQENFTLQLSGIKRWKLRQSHLEHPLRGITPHYKNTGRTVENQLKSCHLSSRKFDFTATPSDSNSFGVTEEIVMYPGDVLYFPAGMWHCVETVEEGVSMNVSLMGRNYADVVGDAIKHLLNTKSEWREVVCGNSSVGDKLGKLLEGLPGIISHFVENEGASDAILPPVLKFPPSFVVDNEDQDQEEDVQEKCQIGKDDDDNDDDDDDDNDDDDDEEDVSLESDHSVDMSSLDSNSPDQIIVDPDSFQAPHGWKCKPNNTSSNNKLIRNPLATLMKMGETNVPTSSLNNIHPVDPSLSSDDKRFILNVCFAGNEMQESTIRVIFSNDHNGVLNKCVECEQNGLDPATIFQSGEMKIDPPDCLFFYGYFIWVKGDNECK